MEQNKFINRPHTYGNLVHTKVASQNNEEMVQTVLNKLGNLLNHNQIK